MNHNVKDIYYTSDYKINVVTGKGEQNPMLGGCCPRMKRNFHSVGGIAAVMPSLNTTHF
jgi:hypothetical protein